MLLEEVGDMMEKLDIIQDYYFAIKSFYLFQSGRLFDIPEFKDYILDKDNLNGTRVAIISSLMLAAKEKIVDNKGNMEYSSKIFMDALENSVLFIATKVENGYKLSNYVFPDAATLVAILRNKLAHGKYIIDFEHNRVIFNHKGASIVVNIDKLSVFVLKAYSSTFKNRVSTKYERNVIYNSSLPLGKNRCLKTAEDVRKVIKNFNYVEFTLESINGIPIMEDCIGYLEGFIKYFKKNYVNALKSDFYKKMIEYFKYRGYSLRVEYKVLRDKKEINEIIDYAKVDLFDNPSLSYLNQVEMIGTEVQKRINGNYKNFDAVLANINNLVLVESIHNAQSVDDNKLNALITKRYPSGLKLSYDEFGMSLISMFNALYIYPFDDVYDTSGQYSTVRDEFFDFANLDLSMVNPNVLAINDMPLVNAKEKLDNIVKKQVMMVKKILQQENNLNKVNGNANAEAAITKSINDLRTNLAQSITDYGRENVIYEEIKKDYTDNNMYFRNKAIIEGIRNSIAHGHYEFVSNGNIWDTKIIFSDIYEGKLTFQVEMKFIDFAKMIEENFQNVIDYVDNKRNGLKKKLI